MRSEERQAVSVGILTAYLIIGGTIGAIWLAAKGIESKRGLPKWLER